MISETVETTKISPYGELLIEALRPYAEIKKIIPRRNLYLNINDIQYCYLLLEGQFGIYRQSDHRMLGSASYPGILGLGALVTERSSVYMKALTPSVAGRLSLDIVQHVIQELNLWEPLAKHMIILSNRLYISNEQLSAPTAFELVRTQLMELINEDSSIRREVTAERYIRDKTKLSRSRIMHILSELKKGGYIEMQKGILVDVIELPENLTINNIVRNSE